MICFITVLFHSFKWMKNTATILFYLFFLWRVGKNRNICVWDWDYYVEYIQLLFQSLFCLTSAFQFFHSVCFVIFSFLSLWVHNTLTCPCWSLIYSMTDQYSIDLLSEWPILSWFTQWLINSLLIYTMTDQ